MANLHHFRIYLKSINLLRTICNHTCPVSLCHTIQMKNGSNSSSFILWSNRKNLNAPKSLVVQTRGFSEAVEHEDDNDRALKELNITLLKPNPEWRNVAAGPVWGEGDVFYNLLWAEWLTLPTLKKWIMEQDSVWDSYTEEHGFTPSEYMTSEEFQDLYNDKLTWTDYRRNKKGSIQRQTTRKSCIRHDAISTGSPCPICRDPKLVITYKNLPLMNEYVDKQTGKLHNPLRTGVCQIQQKRMIQAFRLARELGYLPRSVRFVEFDMEDYKLNPNVL